MQDTLETNLTGEDTAKLNEANESAANTEIISGEAATEEAMDAENALAGKLTKDEILNRLQTLVDAPVETVRGEVESLKQAYYKIRRNEVEALKKAFMEQGGEEKDFAVPEDTLETRLKELLSDYKEKK